MLRIAILVGLLAACGGGTKGPAWPNPTPSDGPDGGESLAPRTPSAIDDSEDDDDDELASLEIDKPAKSTDDSKPASETPRTTTPSSPTVTAPEDVINIDDLVIEVDD